MNLTPVILWLKNGCSPEIAARELELFQECAENQDIERLRKIESASRNLFEQHNRGASGEMNDAFVRLGSMLQNSENSDRDRRHVSRLDHEQVAR